MSTSVAKKEVQTPPALNLDTISRVLMHGDLSRLDEGQKLSYYKNLCESVGLNPLSKPFQYMQLQGKEILYADKGCAEQLRKLHNISIYKIEKESDHDAGTYTVTAYAREPGGREDASTAVVFIQGLRGDTLCNIKMKCETKAKRRVTLSIVGMGMLDESEVSTIPEASAQPVQVKSSSPPPPQPPSKKVSPKTPGDFIINFTKGFKGKRIKEMDPENLQKLLKWCIENNTMHDFIEAGEAFLRLQENEAIESEPSGLPDSDFPSFDKFQGEI